MLGALIGAGASLIGGMLDRDDADERYEDQVQTQGAWNQQAQDFAERWNARSEANTNRWNQAGLDFSNFQSRLQQQNVLEDRLRYDNSVVRNYRILNEDRARADSFIQRRVADARAAGLHPLYALGASSSHSPALGASGPRSASSVSGPARGGYGHSVAPVGQAPSGSFRGLGIGEAAMRLGQMIDDRHYTRDRRTAELRMMDAAATRDLAQAMAFTSDAKRAETPGTKVHALGEAEQIVRRKLVGTAGQEYELTTGSPAQTVEDELGGFWGELHGLKRGAWTSLKRHKPGLYKALRHFTRDRSRELRRGIPGYGQKTQSRWRNY